MGVEVWLERQTIVEPAFTIPVATNSLKADDVIDKSGTPCPICIEKNVVHFQTTVNGKKWHWFVSAFGYQGSFSLQDANGKLLQAMVAAVKGGSVSQNDLRLMDCSEVPDQNCAEWIALQIYQHSPDIVIVMGLSLARLLLLSKDVNNPDALKTLPVEMISGEYKLLELPLIATHHPAEIVIDPSLKRQVWADLQKAIAHSADE